MYVPKGLVIGTDYWVLSEILEMFPIYTYSKATVEKWKILKLKYLILELRFIYFNALLTEAILDYNGKNKVHPA